MEASTLHSRVGMVHDRPVLLINDRITPPLLYGLTDSPGARCSWEEVPSRNIKLFGDRGIRLFQVDLWLEQIMDRKDRMNLTRAREQIAGVLRAVPDAGVMIRFHVNAPYWWCEQNENECVGYADTTPDPVRPWGQIRPVAHDLERPLRASFFSEKWKAWAQKHLAHFCKSLADTPEGRRVMGIQVANGTYGEWQHFGFLSYDPDTGEPARNAYIQYLQGRYQTMEALNEAWGGEQDHWENIHPPSSQNRLAASPGNLRNPENQRHVIDYYRFLQEGTADLILDMAHIVKQSWPRDMITAAFFGYFYSMFGRQAACGQLALERVLESKDLDCLCSPQSYRDTARQLGGSGQSRSLISPILRAGKLWLDEMDESTSLGGCPWNPAFKSTLEDDVAILRRNVLQPVTRGGGLWWYDFGPNAATGNFPVYGIRGAWDHPVLMDEIRKLAAITQKKMGEPLHRFADVLVVHDPMAFCHVCSRPINPDNVADSYPMAEGDFISEFSVDGLGEGLHQSGLIHEEALLSELENLDLGHYKLIIFATTVTILPAMRERIRSNLETFHGHVVFTGFCGWSDGGRLHPSLAEAFTGFALELDKRPTPVRFHVDQAREELTLKKEFPTIALKQAASPAGAWADDSPAAACREVNSSTFWYFAIAPTKPGLLRALGKRAGCRIINECDDTTLLGCGLLVVHTVGGGPRRLKLPGGDVIKTTLTPRSTTVFDSDSSEVLLQSFDESGVDKFIKTGRNH